MRLLAAVYENSVIPHQAQRCCYCCIHERITRLRQVLQWREHKVNKLSNSSLRSKERLLTGSELFEENTQAQIHLFSCGVVALPNKLS